MLVAVLKLEGDKHWQVLESLKVLRNSNLPLSTLKADADFQSFVMIGRCMKDQWQWQSVSSCGHA